MVKPRDDTTSPRLRGAGRGGGKVKKLVIPAQAGTGSEKFYLRYLGSGVKPRDDNGGGVVVLKPCGVLFLSNC